MFALMDKRDVPVFLHSPEDLTKVITEELPLGIHYATAIAGLDVEQLEYLHNSLIEFLDNEKTGEKSSSRPIGSVISLQGEIENPNFTFERSNLLHKKGINTLRTGAKWLFIETNFICTKFGPMLFTYGSKGKYVIRKP